ncbi:Protein of unknown function, partial [Gryllus bimaculatus]
QPSVLRVSPQGDGRHHREAAWTTHCSHVMFGEGRPYATQCTGVSNASKQEGDRKGGLVVQVELGKYEARMGRMVTARTWCRKKNSANGVAVVPEE